MELIEGEREIATWNGLTLSNLRLWIEVFSQGGRYAMSMPLEKIEWTLVSRQRSWTGIVWLLLCLGLGYWWFTESDRWETLAIAAIVGFLLTGRSVRSGSLFVAAGSGNGRIERRMVNATDADSVKARDFVAQVEMLMLIARSGGHVHRAA